MKIVSRPDPLEETTQVGSGSICLMIDDDELELIAALVAHCRLGKSGFSLTAYNLLTLFENEFGSDFVNDVCDNVTIHATIEDDATGIVLCSTKTGNSSVTLEPQ